MPERPAATGWGWLVERGQSENHVPTVWRIAGPDPRKRDGEDWTQDAFKATRYATRDEAQAVVDELFTPPITHRNPGPTARATEHGFVYGGTDGDA